MRITLQQTLKYSNQPMLKVNESQKKALAAVFGVIIPTLPHKTVLNDYWTASAADKDIVERSLALVANLKKEDQNDFLLALRLLDSPMLGTTWLGAWKSAQKLSPTQIERMLHTWASSPLSDLRKLFATLKKLAAIAFYGDIIGSQYAQHIDYKTVIDENFRQKQSINIFEIEKNTTLDCDVVIVGSGAGAGVVAARLAESGQKVIVVEKGRFMKNSDYNQRELDMLRKTYEAQGLLTSKDGAMSILAGNGLGGGTAINWAGCLRTPDWVLEQWATEHQNPQFLDNQYKKGFEYVEKRNSVHNQIPHNPQNQQLWNTAQKLQQEVAYIPQNFKKSAQLDDDTNHKAMGFSSLGDYYGLKQSSTQTFFEDASAYQAQFIPDTQVHRIVINNGTAVGIEAQSGQYKLHIRAKKIVVSAGAINTPVLLLKSGLRHAQIGRNLYLHPVSPVPALYEDAMYPWHGAPMTTIVKQFERLDGNYGFKIECPPMHPGIAGAVFNWQNGEQFKSDMLLLKHMGVFFPLVRDLKGGQVKISPKSKQAEIHYRLSEYDKKHLLQGIAECIKLHAAADAKKIYVIHNQNFTFEPNKQKLNIFLEKIASAKWRSNEFALFSAHQMGTCRMGGNNDSPVKPNGETREVKNLFVADSSLFPSASGANPMLSTQALAYYVAENLINIPI